MVSSSSEPKYPPGTSTPFYLARSEICVDSTGKCIGDGVFAGGNYEPGSHIFTLNRPLVGSLDTERLIDTCAHCYVWTEGSGIGSRLYVKEGTKVQTCAGCKKFRYCSKDCQNDAWNQGHKHECKNLRSVNDKSVPKAVIATMEILTRRKHGLITDNAWELLCCLDTHIEDFKANGKYGGIELMALGTSQLSFTQDTFSKDFVAGMYARVLTNSLTVVTPTFDPLGIMIDPYLCHINHSCDPNAFVVMDGPEVAIRALRPIKKDEEIVVSYIDITNPYSRRQSELKARWFFTCKCSKCQKGPTLQEDNWTIQPGNLAQKWKEVADIIVQNENFAQDPANYVGESPEERRVAALQGKAFAGYEDVQRMTDPHQAVKGIEDGMRLCHQSGLWPVYRQPYAAFRDDLIVNMLTVGNFPIAFPQCAKRYRYILPKLYPEVAHPIRVVQTWQTAMLTLYLASQEGTMGLAQPSVDFSLIAFMLIIEVKNVSAQSHGENSAFAKSVKKKYDEIVTDLESKLGPNVDDFVARAMPRQREIFMEMADWMQY
ncbi:SET domain-containing protein [Lindgomyces ingoldianus]|uniref:SET domain-containing protein n=1 Tax=Lindgomyces ingoldianus TaxID=673940 RepID=A0ACB6Q841_9PLEO|nr:SET domain-containing protein [Lindgomyces ingoldianus]KAF2463037.1 SET domain-containing protein [Lindgomyces ingoldianus]